MPPAHHPQQQYLPHCSVVLCWLLGCVLLLQLKQYSLAVQHIAAGKRDEARAILQQLLHEPLLQEQAVAAAAEAGAAAGNAGEQTQQPALAAAASSTKNATAAM
jgi:hypothetical protein